MFVLQSFSMAYKRRKTSKNSKCSNKNSIPFAVSLDLLQVPLEDTQHKRKFVGMNSDSDVWPRICRPARETCTLQGVMNN